MHPTVGTNINTNLNVSGNATMNNNLTVSGSSNLNNLTVSGSSNLNNLSVSGNATVSGYIKKAITYITILPDQTAYFFYMADHPITPYYFINANNATTLGFYCVVTPPDEGIETVIKNNGTNIVTVYNLFTNGSQSIGNYVIPPGFQLKLASFNGGWYQIL
jgi:hypothetical protein